MFKFRIISCLIACSFTASAWSQVIQSVEVRGQQRVSKEAILKVISSKEGQALSKKKVALDIHTLYDMGFFSDIKVFSDKLSNGKSKLIVQVAEKPAIVEISFDGLKEVDEEDFKEKLETKLYTIVNESSLSADVRVIEKEYAGKGFYLVDVGYDLIPKGKNEVKVVYKVNEGQKVRVGDVFIQGNQYFTDEQIINQLATRPFTRAGSMSSVAVFQDLFVKRDQEFLGLMYKDQGFAKVKVAKPIILMDKDQQYVRVTFKVEEGPQYNIGKIKFSGDLLFPEEKLREEMMSKEGNLFRYTKFARDIEYLIDEYGTLGYAYVDVNPVPTFDDQNNTVSIDIKISKGQKAYFGEIKIVGNSKTRDNVVRRELLVHESELYNGKKLNQSKRDIQRLGFFDEVKIIKGRSTKDPQAVDLTVQVQEKATGQLQAALGYTPVQNTDEPRVFFQGKYDEQNQSGKAWNLKLSGRWNGESNYLLDLSLRDPRINDSLWSGSARVFLSSEVTEAFTNVRLLEKRYGGSVTIGRRVIERVRASLTYQYEDIDQETLEFVSAKFLEGGISSSLIFSLSRNDTNNFLDPSEGSNLVLSQRFTGGLLLGDREYAETSFRGDYYFPIDFSETYRTYFHVHAAASHIYKLTDKDVPFFSRYRLGGFNDLRGYENNTLGPKWNILLGPGSAQEYNKGGDKSLLMQLEYFFPLIPEAGIKGLLFTDWGQVFDNNEAFSFNNLKRDIGFGIRWITPMAPFRFEWAYPIEDGKLGEQQFIFYLGY